jgi:hypothetical protein
MRIPLFLLSGLVFSLGLWPIGCYVVTREVTYFQFLVAVSPVAETVLMVVCTRTVQVRSKLGNLMDNFVDRENSIINS